MRFKTYAIDFDDTITTGTEFPEIGELRPHADRVMRRIKENGGEIAIWTCRTGEHVDRIKEFLSNHEIPYDSFNEILPSESLMWGEGGRKIFADCYIDDRSIHAQMNGGINWLQLEDYIFGDTEEKIYIDASMLTSICLLCGRPERCGCKYESK